MHCTFSEREPAFMTRFHDTSNPFTYLSLSLKKKVNNYRRLFGDDTFLGFLLGTVLGMVVSYKCGNASGNGNKK